MEMTWDDSTYLGAIGPNGELPQFMSNMDGSRMLFIQFGDAPGGYERCAAAPVDTGPYGAQCFLWKGHRCNHVPATADMLSSMAVSVIGARFDEQAMSWDE